MDHGGDRYRNKIELDFSVNVNPLGMPLSVKKALRDSIDEVINYPDIMHQELLFELAGAYHIDENNIVIGNGASEILMAIYHGFRPQKVLIPVPSFSGYKHAFKDSEIIFYKMNDLLELDDAFVDILKNTDADMLMLTNPNNPTGKYIDRKLLQDILSICEERNIKVVLDECFMELSDEPGNTMLKEPSNYKQLIILRAFTKSFAVPGVRLGMAMCGAAGMSEIIKRQLPEWNISVMADAVGKAALTEQKYLVDSRTYIKKERRFLIEGLAKLGIKTFSSSANFILIYKSDNDLYEKLLDRKILIRDCSNYEGLCAGYYRIAVRTREENIKLLDALGIIYGAKTMLC